MRHFFIFGYCSPLQCLNNERNGWDDETSYAFFVEAVDSTEAIDWGLKVAEAYVGYLFEKSLWSDPIPKWKRSNFAYWIEQYPHEQFSENMIEAFPITSVGEIPNFDEWPKAESFGQIAKVDNLREIR